MTAIYGTQIMVGDGTPGNERRVSELPPFIDQIVDLFLAGLMCWRPDTLGEMTEWCDEEVEQQTPGIVKDFEPMPFAIIVSERSEEWITAAEVALGRPLSRSYDEEIERCRTIRNNLVTNLRTLGFTFPTNTSAFARVRALLNGLPDRGHARAGKLKQFYGNYMSGTGNRKSLPDEWWAPGDFTSPDPVVMQQLADDYANLPVDHPMRVVRMFMEAFMCDYVVRNA